MKETNIKPKSPTLEGGKKFMHDMHKIAVYLTFTQMAPKKGIKRHGEQAIAYMYKEYT